MVAELQGFLTHERGHRALFWAEMQRREMRRCRSFFWCGLGGFALGAMTGLAGRDAIAATTFAIEEVVLRHMHEQIEVLSDCDAEAVATLRRIIGEEQEHRDASVARMGSGGFWKAVIHPIVSFSTEAVIWLGMRL